MFNLKASLISILIFFSSNVAAETWGVTEWLNDLQNQWQDMFLDYPRNLSAAPQRCAICSDSYSDKELADLVAFVHDKIYGADAESFPWAQRSRKWSKIINEDWEELIVILADGRERVRVSTELSRAQREKLRVGQSVTIRLKIIREGRSVIYKDLHAEPGGVSRASYHQNIGNSFSDYYFGGEYPDYRDYPGGGTRGISALGWGWGGGWGSNGGF